MTGRHPYNPDWVSNPSSGCLSASAHSCARVCLYVAHEADHGGFGTSGEIVNGTHVSERVCLRGHLQECACVHCVCICACVRVCVCVRLCVCMCLVPFDTSSIRGNGLLRFSSDSFEQQGSKRLLDSLTSIFGAKQKDMVMEGERCLNAYAWACACACACCFLNSSVEFMFFLSDRWRGIP